MIWLRLSERLIPCVLWPFLRTTRRHRDRLKTPSRLRRVASVQQSFVLQATDIESMTKWWGSLKLG
jgi:hypothetical protein